MAETINQLSLSIPFIYGTDQCHIIDTSSFPSSYRNEKGKKIEIQSYFNGSIIRWNSRIIFCCRGDQPSKPDGQGWFENIRLIICELDEDFQPIQGTAKFLNVTGRKGPNRVEDCRLFVAGGSLYCSYGDGYEMYLARINDKLEALDCENITHAGVYIPGNDYREKNWTPFSYDGMPFFVYSDNPRMVFDPRKRQFYVGGQEITWDYGVIRGGTPAIPYTEGKLITFFHAKVMLPGKDWVDGRVYTMGAMLMQNKPPFMVTHITPMPLMRGENIYPNPINKNIYVIFPAGIIEDKDSYWVSLGINDAKTGIIRVSKNLLTGMFRDV